MQRASEWRPTARLSEIESACVGCRRPVIEEGRRQGGESGRIKPDPCRVRRAGASPSAAANAATAVF